MPIFLITSSIDDTIAGTADLISTKVGIIGGQSNLVIPPGNSGPFPQPPTEAVAYCTVENVMEYLMSVGFKQAANLELAIKHIHIPAAKRKVDAYTHTNWEYTRVIDFYDGSSINNQPLKKWPINEVFNCRLRVIPSIIWFQFQRIRHVNQTDTDGRVISNATSFMDDADLLVDCRTGVLTIPPRILYLEMQAVPFWNYTFLPGSQNVQVEFAYGYKKGNFPADIVTATAMLAASDAIITAAIERAQGATSVSIGDVSRMWREGHPYYSIQKYWQEQAFLVLNTRRHAFV